MGQGRRGDLSCFALEELPDHDADPLYSRGQPCYQPSHVHQPPSPARRTSPRILATSAAVAAAARRPTIPRAPSPSHPAASDVISTGNEWIALPTIRPSDAALQNFNVLSMHDRGLLQVNGAAGTPALAPRVMIDGAPVQFANLSWELLDYWIPRAHLTTADAEITITYCAPPGSRAAFVEIVLTNKSAKPIDASVGMHASFGSLDRVTYTPVELAGVRAVGPAAWQKSAQVFSFVTSDTKFAWSFDAFGSATTVTTPPASLAPAADSAQQKTLQLPAHNSKAHFVIGVGVEENTARRNPAEPCAKRSTAKAPMP